MNLSDKDSLAFEDFVSFLKRHPEIKRLEGTEESILSIPGLEIYPGKHKVFRDRKEIHLTAKEYALLLLLVANQGQVLTYSQIYDKIWGDVPSGNESHTIGFHICNLREKLFQAAPDAPFTIRSVREVGYCFEIQTEK